MKVLKVVAIIVLVLCVLVKVPPLNHMLIGTTLSIMARRLGDTKGSFVYYDGKHFKSAIIGSTIQLSNVSLSKVQWSTDFTTYHTRDYSLYFCLRNSRVLGVFSSKGALATNIVKDGQSITDYSRLISMPGIESITIYDTSDCEAGKSLVNQVHLLCQNSTLCYYAASKDNKIDAVGVFHKSIKDKIPIIAGTVRSDTPDLEIEINNH